MRLESGIQIDIRGTRIGGPQPLICLPLVAGRRGALLEALSEMVRLGPDLVEWRFDTFEEAAEPGAAARLLPEIRAALGPLPLIFTCRCPEEGGEGALAAEIRQAQIQSALSTGLVDLVDVEMCNRADFLAAVGDYARAAGAQLILSHHDFHATPAREAIVATLARAQDLGAQVAKIAVMPRSEEDLLTLLQATLAARRGPVQIPMITIAMDRLGLTSRVAGGLFGSDITFASGTAASAPGQIPIADLRRLMAPLYLPG